VCVFLCLCTLRGLATSWSPVQGVLPTVLELVTEVKRKDSWRRPRPELGCRAKGKKNYVNWTLTEIPKNCTKRHCCCCCCCCCCLIMYLNLKFKKIYFILSMHANYYNKPNVPYFFMFQCHICACFIEQRRLMCHETVRSASLISSAIVARFLIPPRQKFRFT
jgi:hypothetical protein